MLNYITGQQCLTDNTTARDSEAGALSLTVHDFTIGESKMRL